MILGLFTLTAGAADPLFFDTNDTGPPSADVPAIKPWRTVPLDPDYGGQWVVAADLDADGEVEFVACENHNVGDVHYTSTAVAQRLDGTVLWRWGDSNIGRKEWHHDVACQIHDWDGDGRDEIAAGFAMLNADGSVRWIFKSSTINLKQGHLDCIRLMHRGDKPEDVRLVLTLCGANGIAMIDGNGKTIWERAGSHFESIDLGRVVTERPGPQILVDIDHQPFGKGPLLLMDENGVLLGRINTEYARHYHLLDWNGDGLDEIFNAHSGALYNNKGRRIATLTAPAAANKGERSLLVGDFTGDGVPDVALVTTAALHIFKNENGVKPRQRIGLETEFNFTLY
jgi:hypothetical protein